MTGEFDAIYKEAGEADEKFRMETTTNTLTAGLSYGVMDNLSVGLSVGYDLVADVEWDGNVTSKLNGMKDPSLALSYRALNDGMMLDLNLGLEMGFQDKEDNATRGGHTVKFGTDLSKKWGAFELMGELNFAYLMEAKTKETDETTTYDPSLDIELTIAGQYAVTNELYIMGRAGYAHIGEVDSKTKEDIGTTKETTESYGKIAFGLGAKYAVNSDMSVSIGHDINTADTYTTKSDDGTSTDYKEMMAHTTYIGMDMAF